MEHTLSGVGVLDKAVAILAVTGSAPATLADLVEGTGQSRATAHRLAVALETHGLLRRGADGRFVLGAGLIALGLLAAEALPLEAFARPVLTGLRDRTGESAQLYVRDGDARRCLVAVDSPHELRTIVAAGALLPLGRGSAGRILGGVDVGGSGWLETIGDREAGVASVSAPVHDSAGAVIAAISVSGPVERIGKTPGVRHGSHVVAAAADLEAALAQP
jgi:DNA-binding IclR family transcriptional regulator